MLQLRPLAVKIKKKQSSSRDNSIKLDVSSRFFLYKNDNILSSINRITQTVLKLTIFHVISGTSFHAGVRFYFVGFFLKIYLFILFFLAALGLCCCAQAKRRAEVPGLFNGGFSYCRAGALGTQASVVVAHWLSSCGSWALERRLSSCGSRA